MSCQLWVLEVLLSQEKVQDELIKRYVDSLPGGYSVPIVIQARLMLRVLHQSGKGATIDESFLNALITLAALSQKAPENYAPYTQLAQISPDFELYLQTKTELVLGPLREGKASKAETYELINKYFPVLEDPGQLISGKETDRRAELVEAAESAEAAQKVLAKYPMEGLRKTLEAFLKQAFSALGPPFLQVLEGDLSSGRYVPFQ